MIVLDVNYGIYISVSETGILRTVVLRCTSTVLQSCCNDLKATAGPLVKWAHEQDGIIPEFATRESRRLVKANVDFWTVVNDYVRSNGTFPPLKLFKHVCQSFYSKTRGGGGGR